MRILGVRQCRERLFELLREGDPVLVLRRGRPAGVLYPCAGGAVPREVQELLDAYHPVRPASGGRRTRADSQLPLLGLGA